MVLTVGIDEPNPLVAVSCPTTKFCATVETANHVLVSTEPEKNKWSAPVELKDVDTLSDIACPSSSLCIAVGGFEEVISGKSVQNGVVVTSKDPIGGSTKWSAAKSIDPEGIVLVGVSCPTSEFCAAVDAKGDLLTSSDPEAGSGSWSIPENIAEENTLVGISCASTKFCAALGNEGRLFVSTDPEGHSGTWESVSLEIGRGSLSCAPGPGPFCTVIGSIPGDDEELGYASSSADPLGGESEWSAPTLIDPTNHRGGEGAPIEVSCPAATLCVAVDKEGNVLTGTPITPPIQPPTNTNPSPGTKEQSGPAAGSGPSIDTRPPIDTGPPPARGPSASQLALRCDTRKLALTDVIEQGNHVLLNGAADASLAGKNVTILFAAIR